MVQRLIWSTRLLRALGLGILLFGLAACGSDDDDDPAPTDVPTVPPVVQEAVVAAAADGCWTAEQRVGDVNGKPQWSAAPAMTIDPAKSYTARVETSLGGFTVQFLAQEAPQTVNSFVCLARAGFFDGVVFHRVVPGFVIQGGDPTGTGRGGPGYRFADELPTTTTYERGTLAMANAGAGTNGSQFFVCLDDLSQRLPPNFSIFGRVTEGIETVDAIAAVPLEQLPGAPEPPSSPVDPVTIASVTITEA